MAARHLSAAARKDQIMDAARALFLTKGYEPTTVEDILTRVGIAKGTLYHHFPSKEAIMEAIVVRTADAIAENAQRAASSDGPALTRLLAVLGAARAPEDDIELAQQFRSPNNTRFYLLSLTESYNRLVPIMTRVVEEGVAAGELNSPDPRSSVEVILAAALTLLDGGIFLPASEDARADTARRQAAILSAGSFLLGADPRVLASLAAPLTTPANPDDADRAGAQESEGAHATV